MDLKKLNLILENTISEFKIAYVNFNRPEFAPYQKRKIGAVVRFDEKIIYIHSELPRREEELTWLHEALSIYYYNEGMLRHDEEIEKEARRIYKQPGVGPLLTKHIERVKNQRKGKNSEFQKAVRRIGKHNPERI